ncbi:hypothetical protein CI610_01213 [invertebrate metagenome]|uniref:Pilus assembly protein PilP n=1 Tax=invertebrate metagenome TaxID=1711999 RepID=A0A2H9T9J4_9ZZZZ
MYVRSYFLNIPLIVLLSGCSNEHSFNDLETFIQEVRATPGGEVEQLPDHQQHAFFSYNASGLRSPFTPILNNKAKTEIRSDVKPDDNRAQHYLETFDIDTFQMVGTMSNEEGLWALLEIPQGIFRVKEGDYLGKNHGKVTLVDNRELHLTEIVPAGPDTWIERPRILKIQHTGP